MSKRSVERWRRARREGGTVALRSAGPANSPTVDLGENGYRIGFTDDYGYLADMPFEWRCGPAT